MTNGNGRYEAMKKLLRIDHPVFWMLIAFCCWIFSFSEFLGSYRTLVSDALSYYEHIKFFVLNLSKGVYPLWDPFWYHGASNDFFLRRIGAFNPFYLLIILFNSIGIPYIYSYLWFLALYYFLGMTGFYLLAMRIFNDRLIAYGGFLILLFSALGTRLFDAYMMLITIPLIWFFYFLVAFSQTPRKHLFLGLSLSAMILLGTYIPFYFLWIMILFSFCFGIFFFKEIPGVLKRWVGFFKTHKILCAGCVLVLMLSCLPIVLFYGHSTQGNVVLPLRQGKANEALTVPLETLNWGVVEDFMFSGYFSNLRQYKFAIVYIPFFAIVVFGLGLLGRITRRAAFLFFYGFLFVCLTIPHGLPFYSFLYKHVYILKFFRNLHFFIWFILIPLFVVLVLEHWHIFEELRKDERSKKYCLGIIGVIHLAAIIFITVRGDAIFSTYVMLLLSAIFWVGRVLNWFAPRWAFALLTLTVLIQPLEVYHHFTINAAPFKGYETYFYPFDKVRFNDEFRLPPSYTEPAKSALYYASGPYNFLNQNVSGYILSHYLQNKFLLVDHVEKVDSKAVDVERLNQIMKDQANVAFVFDPKQTLTQFKSNDPHSPSKAIGIGKELSWFKIPTFNANHLRLVVDIPYEKFLVYNDSYDPLWKATVNGSKVNIYQTNEGFKGIWLPAGHSTVDFSYGTAGQYVLNIFLSLAAFVLLVSIIIYALI